MVKGIQGKSGLFCLLTDRIGPEVLEAATQLKVVATMSVGCDHLDISELRKRNIRIGYTPDVLTDATADLAVALLLATSRRLIEANAALKAGEWPAWSPLWMCGPSLRGATVGIVGLGRIGQAVRDRLKPFGVGKFLYFGRSKKQASEEQGAEFTSFNNLLENSDFVMVTVAFSPALENLFNAEAFSRMKSSGILINVSRGGLVQQDDLVAALQGGDIAAAGLDVMVPEPLPAGHPLTLLPNCVLLPHIGSADIGTRTRMAVMTSENIIGALYDSQMPAELL